MCSLRLVLCLTLLCPSENPKRPSDQLRAVLDAINEAVLTEYYDPAVSAWWRERERTHESRILNAQTEQDAVDQIRQMLSELHNSHIFFYTREERNLAENVLPFTFEKRGERVFVRRPLVDTELRFGDEIVSINGEPASALEPRTLAKVQGVYSNPLYGQLGSAVTLIVALKGHEHRVQVRRIKLEDVKPIEVEQATSDTVLIRFLKLNADENGKALLQSAWQTVLKMPHLVLDLRDCSGGDLPASSFILDSLLGSSRKDFRVMDRLGAEVSGTQSFAVAPRYMGRVAVITGEATQSGCELLAAGLKESTRGILVGTRTAGAFNGFTKAFPMPDGFAVLALPYTKTVSPQGRSYEGTGVMPDKVVSNNIDDFRTGHDRVLETAVRLAN